MLLKNYKEFVKIIEIKIKYKSSFVDTYFVCVCMYVFMHADELLTLKY